MTSNNSFDDVNVEYSEVLEQSDQDSTQESLTEQAKYMLDAHEINRADIVQKAPTANELSTPATVKRTMSIMSSDATPVVAAFSEGMLPQSRRAYLNIAETKEENKRLKAEVFDLKSQLFILKRDLPKILNGEGKNFTDEYVKIRTELDSEKLRRAELEEFWHSQKKKYDHEKAKLDKEKSEMEKKYERILLEKEELENELKEFRNHLSEKIVDHDDGNDSQGDSSLSNISIMSERGAEMERLRSMILQNNVEKRKIQNKMGDEIAQLQMQLKCCQDNLEKQIGCYEDEKTRCQLLKAEVVKLKHQADSTAQELENNKQAFEEKLAKVYAENEVAINKRDRTIRVLLKKLKSEATEANSNPKSETNSLCSQHHEVSSVNPYAQRILDQINEFGAKNEAIRKKLIESGLHEVDLTSEVDLSEVSSTENSSEWDAEHCERENRKLAAFLAANDSLPESAREQNLKSKIALLDADTGDTVQRQCLKEHLEDSARSVGASELLNITSAADLLSKSLLITEDFAGIKKKLSILHTVSTRLFEKLRGTANFLQSLLDELGAGDRGRELLAQIEALRIDLDQSLATAKDLSRDVQVMEESIGDWSAQLQRSMNCSFGITSVASTDNQQNTSVLLQAQSTYKQLNEGLRRQRKKTVELNELNEQLRARITDLEEDKQKLHDELIQLKKELAVKEDEINQYMEDVAKQTELNCDKCIELYEQIEGFQKCIEMKEREFLTKMNEMQHSACQMLENCRDLEMKLAETNHALSIKDELVKKLETDIEQSNEQLISRNNVLAHYRFEITELDIKVCKLISDLKESCGIVGEQFDKPIIESADANDIALTQLAQIETDIEELSKIGSYISDLKNQIASLRRDLNLCEEKCSTITAKCRELSNRNANFVAERDEYRQIIDSLEQDLEAKKLSVISKEREKQALIVENECMKENYERIAHTLAEVEIKNEKLLDTKQNRSCAFEEHPERYTMTVSTMTSLSAQDLVEMTDKMRTLTSFVKQMHMLAARWSAEGASDSSESHKAIDLDHLYHTYAQILKLMTDELNDLRDKLALNNAQLLSIELSERRSHRQSGSFKSKEDQVEIVNSLSSNSKNEIGNIGSLSSNLKDENIGNELTLSAIQALFDAADQIVQKLKAISEKPRDEEVEEISFRMRSLRSHIASFQKQYQQSKENLAPTTAVSQGEIDRLKQALRNAKNLLRSAHERLNKLPNSKEMCEQILREMNKINEVMKASSRDLRRIGTSKK